MSRWLQMIGGGQFFLTRPTVEQVDFAVMARVLSRIPRFNAHTEVGTLSVGQHMHEGAWAILRDLTAWDFRVDEDVPSGMLCAAAFSLHDCHEFAMGDIATPVADSLADYAVLESGDLGAADVVKRAIKSMKATLDEAIFAAAGIEYPLDPVVLAVVKEYDVRMCKTERDARLAKGPVWTDYPAIEAAEPLQGVDLRPWSAEEAETRLMTLWHRVLPRFNIVDSKQSL